MMLCHQLLALGRIQLDPLKRDLLCQKVFKDLSTAPAAFSR